MKNIDSKGKLVALIAHDNMKPLLVAWAERHVHKLKNYKLVATGTTGKRVEEATGLKLKKYKSGPLGGDQQIGALIAEQKLDALIFFWDPLEPMPHDPDVKALLRLCSVYNIPVACNEATAEMVIKCL
ncbi:MAG: methylglyoxal synthase [Flavobacteriales bacterium]